MAAPRRSTAEFRTKSEFSNLWKKHPKSFQSLEKQPFFVPMPGKMSKPGKGQAFCAGALHMGVLDLLNLVAKACD